MNTTSIKIIIEYMYFIESHISFEGSAMEEWKHIEREELYETCKMN